jgi:hypothetical protein
MPAEMSMSMLVKFLAVIFFTPLFFLPGVGVGILGGWCGVRLPLLSLSSDSRNSKQIYIAAQLSVKRDMSNMKAPVIGQCVAFYSYCTLR